MKEFKDKNLVTWEWNMQKIPAPALRQNLFCFGNDKGKNRMVAKRYAEYSVENGFPCIIATENPDEWANLIQLAKNAGYVVEHCQIEECVADTEEDAYNKADVLMKQTKRLFDIISENDKVLVLMVYPDCGQMDGATLFDYLTDALGQIDDDITPIQIVLDDIQDGKILLFPPVHMFSLNLNYCVTMGQEITDRDWREDIQDVICESKIYSISPALYDILFDDDADTSYERFFALFQAIICTGVDKDVVSQMRFFMHNCLAMLPTKKKDMSLPFLVWRDPGYMIERFDKVASFYDEVLEEDEGEDEFDDIDIDESDFQQIHEMFLNKIRNFEGKVPDDLYYDVLTDILAKSSQANDIDFENPTIADLEIIFGKEAAAAIASNDPKRVAETLIVPGRWILLFDGEIPLSDSSWSPTPFIFDTADEGIECLKLSARAFGYTSIQQSFTGKKSVVYQCYTRSQTCVVAQIRKVEKANQEELRNAYLNAVAEDESQE